MCVASHLAHRALYTVFLHLISRFHILPQQGTDFKQIDPVSGLRDQSLVAAPAGRLARFIPRDGIKLESWLNYPDGFEY